MKNPKKYFEGFLSGVSRISRVWGRHSPTRFPQGQNERKANFGTAVESCSKKLPDCRSLPTATFSENRNQLFHKSCRIALTCYCHFFGKSITSFFHKRRQAGILPLTPYNTAKSKNDGLSGKNFSGGSVFPDNKAFWKLCFARCLKKTAAFFWFHYLIRNFWKFAKNERKKSSKSFSDLLLHVPLRGGGIFSFYVIGQAGT